MLVITPNLHQTFHLSNIIGKLIMTTEINSKIISWSVASNTDVEPSTTAIAAIPVPTQADKPLKLPPVLEGRTITIKDPSDHATYVTINRMVVDGEIKPVQLFVVSKDPEKVLACQLIGRLVSAIYRQNPGAEFVIEELKAITDSRSGYRMGSRWYPSWVAHVGYVLAEELEFYNTLVPNQAPATGVEVVELKMPEPTKPDYVKGPLCPKCGSDHTAMDGGCFKCLDCDYTKCD